ncbi:MAG: 6-pyruvoyl-tetrahydropterin synthase-related protein [Microgenomates group bacterium]
MHDSTSIARVYLLEKTLSTGQFPAIWAGELNDGAGYPLFHFYAPLTTYLGLLGKFISGSYFVGLKLVLVLASLLGMTGMYSLARKWGRGAGIVSAFAYALLPYAAVNLYVRGAFAEYLAMGLLPWVFYCWVDIGTRRKQLSATFITTLFLLSHNLIPLITAPFLLIWIIINKPKNLKNLVLPILATLTLTAFYLIPLLFERSFVQADSIARTTDYSLHFVSPAQLWNSTWGYGGSAAGIEDGMSFKVGKIQLLLAMFGSILIIFRSKRKELFFLISAIIALFMTTSYSNMIWQNIKIISIVQFPWRYLVLVGFFVSILAGYSVTFIKSKFIQFGFSAAIVILFILLNLKYFVPQSTFVANQGDFTNSAYLSNLPNIIPEYAPRWLITKNIPFENSTVLPYYYYPTWQVQKDGKDVQTFPSSQGMLAISNPSHSTNIVAKQSHTGLEIVANFMSLVALIVTIKLYVKA